MDTEELKDLNKQLIEEILGGNLRKVQDIIKVAQNQNCRDLLGNTPLMYAATCPDKDILLYLLLMGAEPTAYNKQGWTALTYAASVGNRDNVMLITGHSSQPLFKKTNIGNYTADYIAERSGHHTTAELIKSLQNFLIPPSLTKASF